MIAPAAELEPVSQTALVADPNRLKQAPIQEKLKPAPLITDQTGGSAKPIEFTSGVFLANSVLGAHIQEVPSVVGSSPTSDPDTQTTENAQTITIRSKLSLNREEIIFGLTTAFTPIHPNNDDPSDP